MAHCGSLSCLTCNIGIEYVVIFENIVEELPAAGVEDEDLPLALLDELLIG